MEEEELDQFVEGCQFGYCHFCGNTEDFDIIQEENDDYHVFCSACFTQGPFGHSPERALMRWNTKGFRIPLLLWKIICKIKGDR